VYDMELALGKLAMMVVKTTKSFNIGLMAEAVSYIHEV